ncbi:SDR family NAD(P)-dependent oxidoreductase [Methylorubrum populi]
MHRVVIDGGTGGIGLATARALRARGVPLHLVGRDAGRLETAAAELGETGFPEGDVTDPGLCSRVAQEAGPRLGGLVYAIGTIQLAPAIRVNVVAPSLTRTPLAEAITRNQALASGIAAMHALQRLGEPEDGAALAAFLVSAEASYVTGQGIGVDGGCSSLRAKG